MASEDKDGAAVPSSLWASRMGPWDAILEAAREQLPSLDSDSSLSDCEDGELFIFQRDRNTLIPDLAEELAEKPAEDPAASGRWAGAARGPPPQPVLVPVEFPAELGSKWKARAEDSAFLEGRDPPGPLQSCGEISSLRTPKKTPRWQEGDLGSLSSNTQEPQHPLQGWREGAAIPAWRGHLPSEAVSTTQHSSDSVTLRALRRERRKMIEKDILRKVTWDCPDAALGALSQAKEATEEGPRLEVPAEGPREGQPVLSLKQLEEWDLDYILQGLTARGGRGDGASSVWWAARRPQGPGCTLPEAQDRLMERLALLCATQDRASPSAKKVPADGPQDTKEPEAGSRRASAKPGHKLAEDLRLRSVAEPPTIFIDLRQTEPPGCQSSESSACTSSDSEEGEEGKKLATLRAQQGPAERACPSSQQLRDCTGKSQLLQQLRAARKALAQPELTVSEGPGSQEPPAPEDAARSGTGRGQPGPLRAAGQSVRARPPRGSTRAAVPREPLGPGAAREALVPPLGQL